MCHLVNKIQLIVLADFTASYMRGSWLRYWSYRFLDKFAAPHQVGVLVLFPKQNSGNLTFQSKQNVLKVKMSFGPIQHPMPPKHTPAEKKGVRKWLELRCVMWWNEAHHTSEIQIQRAYFQTFTYPFFFFFTEYDPIWCWQFIVCISTVGQNQDAHWCREGPALVWRLLGTQTFVHFNERSDYFIAIAVTLNENVGTYVTKRHFELDCV